MNIVVPSNGRTEPMIIVDDTHPTVYQVVSSQYTNSYIKSYIFEDIDAHPTYTVEAIDKNDCDIGTLVANSQSVLYAPYKPHNHHILRDLCGCDVIRRYNEKVLKIDSVGISGDDVFINIGGTNYSSTTAMIYFDIETPEGRTPLGILGANLA